MNSKRKPYVRTMNAAWWTRLGFYKLYMIRECASIFVIWFCLVLLYGVYASHHLDLWVHYLDFMRNPIVFVLSIISLVAALWQTVTWFNLTPKASRIIINGQKLSESIPIIVCWVVMVVISILLLWLYFC